jgi:excisionase family DNA binding protein
LTTNEDRKQATQGDIMTVGELAEFLRLHPSMRLHPSTIYRLLRRGKLPAFKVGSNWGFSREAIGRLVQLETRQ